MYSLCYCVYAVTVTCNMFGWLFYYCTVLHWMFLYLMHRRRSSVNLGGGRGQDIFARKYMHEKLTKMPELYMTFARKIIKIPEFYMIYMPEKINKMPEFYTIFARRNSFCPNVCVEGQLPFPAPRLLRLWSYALFQEFNIVICVGGQRWWAYRGVACVLVV